MTEKNGYYQLSVEEILSKFETKTTGLTAAEAASRLDKYGPNELKSHKPSPIMRFLRQFNSPLVYVLLIAAAITGFLTLQGEHMLPDTVVIAAVVVLNVILGFFQEGKTESALEALKKMIVSECAVLRDGEQVIIPTRELVPGDVVLLTGGDRVPADLRLIFIKDVFVDESILTGESVPVQKTTECVSKANLSPGDQLCMVFSGTYLTRGTARGVVAATAENTEFGKIAMLVKTTKKVITPLQRKIAIFTRTLMITIFALGALNFILGYVFGFDLSYSFLATIALIVAAMPEMLPMLVTSILALSSSAMARRNALIRLLPAAETLGSTSVICSDKTGTLTKNQMTVMKVFTNNEYYTVSGSGYSPLGTFQLNGTEIKEINQADPVYETLRGGLICNDATLKHLGDDKYDIVGDPTEGALVVAAAKAGITDNPERLDEIPFESEKMYMATLVAEEAYKLLYVKGSPEVVLKMCTHSLTKKGIGPIDTEYLLEKADEMAAEGLRLIAIAHTSFSDEKNSIYPHDIAELTFLGFAGMIDPPREEVIDAIAKCKTAGIRTVMITGDHAITAKAIAAQLGIITRAESVQKESSLTGTQLAIMSDDELFNVVEKISVYARVAPEHKLKIARQLQRKGHIVAMTGDGVNDAPALRTADIGIAMGSGTEVSKEAASMILTDNNFASIVAAVEEGRHAWNNIEKAILYTLPTNGGQALLIMAAILLAPFIPLFELGLPLEPIMILWINLFDSVFLTMPIMMEPKESGLLRRKPRDPGANLANRLFFTRVGIVSLVMAGLAFFVYWTYGHYSISNEDVVISQAKTAAFATVTCVHLGYVITARSVHRSAFTFSPFTNKWLLAGITLTVLANLSIIYLPLLNNVFRTSPFPTEWWWLILCGLPAGFLIPELEKFIRRKKTGNRFRD